MTSRVDTAKNLTGISSLLKYQQKIKPDIDIQKYESDLIGNNRSTNQSKSSRMSAGECVKDVNELLEHLDIDIHSDIVSKRHSDIKSIKSNKSNKSNKNKKHKKRSSYSSSSSDSSRSSSSSSSSSSSDSDTKTKRSSKSSRSSKNLNKSEKKRYSKNNSKRSSDSSKSSSDSSLSSNSSYSSSGSSSSSSSGSNSSGSSRTSSSDSYKSSKRSSKSSRASNKSKDPYKISSTMGMNPNHDFYGHSLKDFTEEQKTQFHINNVLSEMGENKNFSVDEERNRDWKINAINEIVELKTILEMEGEDLSHLPTPSLSDNDNLIRDIRTTLQYKNNRNMDFSLAENLATAAAYGVETVFNGERDFFGSKINMQGWHVNVKNRLRRRRFETTEFVSGVMREYKIGPPFRLGLELIFDAFMHHKSMQQRTRLNDGRTIPSEINTTDAINDIRHALD